MQSQENKIYLKKLRGGMQGVSLKNEYLRGIEPEFESTCLVCSSGAQMGSNHEQNRGRKSRDTAPLSTD